MDGDSVPDDYQLYGKVSVGPLAKNTSVTTQTKKGKIIWNEVLNFPTVVSPLHCRFLCHTGHFPIQIFSDNH